MGTTILFEEDEKWIWNTDWYTKLTYPHICEILNEAIDFHPFPYLLKYIEVKTKIDSEEIKKAISTVESSLNYRKKYTIIISENYRKTNVWQIIRHHLDEFRYNISKKDNFILYEN